MKRNTLTWLWRSSGSDKGKILAMTLVQTLLGGTAVLSAWILRSIIDCAVQQDPHGFWRYAAAFVGLTLVQLTLRAVYRHLTESCRSSLENRFKNQLFSALLGAQYSSVSAVHSGEWMNRLTSDTMVVADGMTSILPEACGMIVKLLAALGLLMVMLPALAPYLLAGGAILVLLTWAFRKHLKKLHTLVQEADGSLRTFLTERLGAMLVLRAFGRQQDTLAQGAKEMSAHRAARMKRNAFHNLCNIGFGLAIYGAYVLGALYCGYGILSGTMSYGTFTAVLQLIGQIQSPFANISGFVPRFYAMLASAERLMEAERFPEDCPEGNMSREEAAALYSQMTAIALENVSFAYPNDPSDAVRDLSFTVEKGEYIAFTGPSGCGKSTVLKLLLALYPLKDGALSLKTRELPQSLAPYHRSLFAYVPQGNVLMTGTVRQVLTFDDPSISDEDLWQALKIACAEDFVRQLEQGLQTPLSERGAGLSEGQLQRLAIARAILSDRPILLLDEATSALDEATEAEVLRNLRAMTDKTVLIVTHRPAALSICDRQIAFDK